MKIAIIIPKLANQGPILVVKDLISEIKDKVTLIDVYYFDDINEIELNCNCYRISFNDSIEFDNYDIIHSHMFRPDLYIWKNRKKIKKAKTISTLHQDIFKNLQSSYNFITAIVFEKIWLMALRSQHSVVTLTKTMEKHYKNNLSGVLLHTIYNGRAINSSFNSLSSFEESFFQDLKSKYKVIGVLALLTKRKGISQIVRVLPYLKDYAVVIVGDGKEKERLAELSIRLNVSDRCLFLGYKKDAYRYLPIFDVYAMSSYSEGFPLSLLEAAQQKLPIVCSNIPLFKELFSDSEVSYFELDNIQSLKGAILKAINNKSYFSENIFLKTSKEYSVKKMAENYLNLYNEIICSVMT